MYTRVQSSIVALSLNLRQSCIGLTCHTRHFSQSTMFLNAQRILGLPAMHTEVPGLDSHSLLLEVDLPLCLLRVQSSTSRRYMFHIKSTLTPPSCPEWWLWRYAFISFLFSLSSFKAAPGSATAFSICSSTTCGAIFMCHCLNIVDMQQYVLLGLAAQTLNNLAFQNLPFCPLKLRNDSRQQVRIRVAQS